MVKVTGILHDMAAAEAAVSRLRGAGFDKEISILAKEQGAGGREEKKTGMGANTTMYGGDTDTLTNGSATGSAIGGLAGLAAGAGALVIPGIGPILAAGPLAGALTGAVTGGVAGGLVDWGIPAGESRQYEEDIKQGRILVIVECSEDKADKAMDILKQAGSAHVKKH